MADPKTKDLTSLIDLSKAEMEKAPPAAETPLPKTPEQTATETKTLESEFASLDTLTITEPEAPVTTEQAIAQPITTEAPTTTEPWDVTLSETETQTPTQVEPSLTSIESAVATEVSMTEPSLTMPEPTMAEETSFLQEPLVTQPTFTQEPTAATKNKTPLKAPTDLTSVKEFGEKLTIGKPRVEASPAFSLLATGKFNVKTRKIIEDAVGSEDFGVTVEDVSVQLKSGKLFVPQISEFAAITLAQKIRDVVDSIEIGLAEEIFKGSAAELAPEQSFILDKQHQEEAHDLENEPQSQEEVFSSNLANLQDFKIIRVLSTLTVTEVLSKEIAETPTSKKFETVTQRLTKELISRAFKLRANGVIGISFSLNPIGQKAYRILATGTAVRLLKNS